MEGKVDKVLSKVAGWGSPVQEIPDGRYEAYEAELKPILDRLLSCTRALSGDPLLKHEGMLLSHIAHKVDNKEILEKAATSMEALLREMGVPTKVR